MTKCCRWKWWCKIISK